MDVFKLTQSGYISEFEIKVSKSDYNKDFEKGVTHWKNGKSLKHDLIKSGKRCNRFFYVFPDTLFQDFSHVPDYCGIVTYGGNGLHSFKLVRNAKLLSKNKMPESYYRHIAQNLQHRVLDAQNKVRGHRHRETTENRKWQALYEKYGENEIAQLFYEKKIF